MSASVRIPLIALSLLATLGLAGCTEGEAETVQEPSLRPVKVIQVEAPSTARELRYSGTVKARSEAAAGFRVAGKIVERLVDVGDHVVPGDVLARLDVTDYQLQVRSAKASLDAAERQLETADFALKRADALYRQQVTTKAQLEQAQLSYNQALATRDSQRSSLAQARNQVAYGELKADKPGIVTAISADAGQVVAAGSPVVTVAADGEKEALIAVPENEIFAFQPGKEVEVGFWSKDGLALKGKVREVAGSADATSRTFAVRITLPDNPQILLGMTARVTALAPSDKSLFELPLSALSQDASKQTTVWTVDRTKATVHARPVTVDTFSDTGVQVSAGLKPGDLVVVAGTQFMAEDMKVKLSDQDLSRAADADGASAAPAAATP
ncbi:efflux RND transporter periplasmic adaptor subunit [Rhizobium sp. AQ_MP]|uniref:efflux RND transporter periplasmic adaptor subunit n=1 Tax=Rhizobium sp. AQ_MP TaxID=2761536 RepID=UPI001639EB57|nr:efflux RND transporter periplasmic adaptor subunit [Rhizobium sp. AQ_MP]MBC2771631.1 efflux RND transporter periplasmic adaptor subunit [Rhizobium sp. AQ_MP]